MDLTNLLTLSQAAGLLDYRVTVILQTSNETSVFSSSLDVLNLLKHVNFSFLVCHMIIFCRPLAQPGTISGHASQN